MKTDQAHRATYTLRVNGEVYHLPSSDERTLAEVLREDLGRMGVKIGCGTGECGACTVLLDGVSIRSCLMLPQQAEGKEVRTIEGLAENGHLHPIQQAFVDHFAVQCGFCTPGMILTAEALLRENPTPSEAQVRQALSGNLCRCTGYFKIVEAVLAASESMRVTDDADASRDTGDRTKCSQG